jgi:hypothetical protein
VRLHFPAGFKPFMPAPVQFSATYGTYASQCSPADGWWCVLVLSAVQPPDWDRRKISITLDNFVVS